MIEADFNVHDGDGNRGDEDVLGMHGDKARNAQGQMAEFVATRMFMAVANTYFKKRVDGILTYKSGESGTQVDYILCRRANQKYIANL